LRLPGACVPTLRPARSAAGGRAGAPGALTRPALLFVASPGSGGWIPLERTGGGGLEPQVEQTRGGGLVFSGVAGGAGWAC